MKFVKETRFSALFLLMFFVVGDANAQAPVSRAWEYDKSSTLSLRKCFREKFLGVKVGHCINPGKMGGGSKGSASVVTFANADDGTVGGMLILQHDYHVEAFGKKTTIGVTCAFNHTKSSSVEFFVGHSLSTPPIPSISVVDILTVAISAKMKASKGIMRGVKSTANKTGTKFNSGYAGAVKNSAFKALVSQAASGCTFRHPDYKLFRGVPGVEIYKVGVNFVAGASNWKFFRDGGASVDVKMSMTPSAKIGGNRIRVKVAGQTIKWKLPSYKFEKNISLVSHNLVLKSKEEKAREFRREIMKKKRGNRGPMYQKK